MTQGEDVLTLAGIAELAQVQRPVVTMWRSRPVAVPFPQPLDVVGGVELFAADAVVTWLEETGRGNSADPRSDVMRYARPSDLVGTDDLAAVLEAMLCLVRSTPELGRMFSTDDVLDLADELDPDDEFLYSEVEHAGDRAPSVLRYVTRLVRGAYGLTDALSIVDGRVAAEQGRCPTRLAQVGLDLLGELIAAVALDLSTPSVMIDDQAGRATELVAAAVTALQEGLDVSVSVSGADAVARSARRRHLIRGLRQIGERRAERLLVVNLLGREDASGTDGLLDIIDELQLGKTDADRAVILGPAAVLCDGLAREAQSQRADVLRLGRVRLIVRLPPGLLVQHPRQRLGVWVLGPEADDRPIDERTTMTADLTDVVMTSEVTSRLATDAVAALESRQGLHAFSFAEHRKLSEVLAAQGPIVAPGSRPPRAVPAAMSEVIDLQGLLSTSGCGADVAVVPQGGRPGRMVTLGSAEADGLLRVLPGVRLAGAPLETGALRLITRETLTARREPLRVDPLSLEREGASTRRTEPGDVVFVTSPRPMAEVDEVGYAVVAYPARIIRVAKLSGLVPQAVAEVVNTLPERSRSWRGWELPRFSPDVGSDLGAVLSHLDGELADLERRRVALLALKRGLPAVVAAGHAIAHLKSAENHEKRADARSEDERLGV